MANSSKRMNEYGILPAPIVIFSGSPYSNRNHNLTLHFEKHFHIMGVRYGRRKYTDI